ncbi:hypothetical protein BH11MYX3_BH11MYX3_43600 [soil metagenome]
MRTTTGLVVAGLFTLIACEKDPRREVASAPAPKVAPAPKPAPAISARIEEPPLVPVAREVPTRTVRVPAPTGPLPTPPSMVPAEYQTWLRALPRQEQKRIATFCSKHRLSLEAECGGIGPLHIPYPPFPRARMKGENDPKQSLFASSEEWQASLTPQQLRYIDRECVGGEERDSSDLCGDNTPLVVAFDRQPIVFTRSGTFAFQPGAPAATDWPTASTPWIAFDRNGNGAIDSGAELFGSDTVLPGGATATNGFLALAALDSNHDGRIDASDLDFASLVLWSDRDGDQRSSSTELTALSATIVSISLANHIDARCDARDNCEGERASFTWRDAGGALRAGTVVDVYLPRR